MASFKELMAKKRASPSAGELVAPEAPKPGLMLSGRVHVPTVKMPDEEALLRGLGIPPKGAARKLGETVPDVPYVFHSEIDSPGKRRLKAALLAEETRLGVWINPEGTDADAWLAVQADGEPNLLLLWKLPLLNRKGELSEPF